mgnify:CR=1 FL=1
MFEIGATYHRRNDIHSEFGGNQQSGIVPSPSHPYVFLFSSPKGEEFGYLDGWVNDTDYLYSGEGQHGNQVFLRGNRAIRDHVANGRELHVFERKGAGTYVYVGEFRFISFKIVTAKDTEDNSRDLIKFFLRRV